MMKLLPLLMLAAAIFSVDAGIKKMMRMMAMNGGMMNGGMMNPGMMNGANPAMMGGRGLAPPMGPGGGPGFGGQPFAQFAPRVPAYAFQPQVLPQAPMGVPSMYNVPYMGVPQMADPFQQQAMGLPGGGAMAQRFKRQLMKQQDTAMDTQIPTPPGIQKTTIPCDAQQENN